ncbi:hypothetical protein BDV11DRAFT_174909 [Aspergillus similis]
MPRSFDSSSRYLPPTAAEEGEEQARLTDTGLSRMEPLTTLPNFASITWLASKIQFYGEPHVSATGIRAAALIGQGATFFIYRSNEIHGIVRAVKKPRLSFEQSQDDTRTMKQLYSLHLELRVLTDERIRAHDNIAKLVSVVWEEHADDLGRLWPSLVMEFANKGTLSACYRRGLTMTVEEERTMCFSIGDALHYLHLNGVIHGDIKPDNILVFGGKEPKPLTVKLSDFGYSVLDGEDAQEFPGGTPDWESPELLERRQTKESLPLSDTYSYGLLIWYIAAGGQHPFESLSEVHAPFDSEDARQAIRDLKQTASIPDIATWTLTPDRGLFSTAFQLTLTKDPVQRDLKRAVSYLKPEASSRDGSLTTHHRVVHNSANRFSLRELRHLGTPIQCQILDSLQIRAGSSHNSDVQRAEAALIIAMCCLESMGGRRPEDAMDWLIRAGSLGHRVAKVLVYRVSASLGLFEERKDEIIPLLKQSANDGFILALSDLSAIDKMSVEKALQQVLERQRELSIGSMPADPSPSDKEALLHEAACLHNVSLVDKLLSPEGGAIGYINSRDTNGRTPLLKACMARDCQTVLHLLERGADASIADRDGDTPLHWLFCFDEDPWIDHLADQLISGGADVNAHTRKQWKNGISFREMPLGTPLHRAATRNSSKAVRSLLRHDADPLVSNMNHKVSTPVYLACVYHSDRALEDMLHHLKKKGQLELSGVKDKELPLILPVLDHGYYYRLEGMLGRIARHGASLDIIETVLTLAPEMAEQNAATKKQPPLHFAVEQDRADIVQLLLSGKVNPQSRDINGISALAKYANHRAGLEIPQILLNAGLRFEVPETSYQTPFFAAVIRSSFDLAAFILKKIAPSERRAMINKPATKGASFTYPPPGITVLGYLLSDMHQRTPRIVDCLLRIVSSFQEQLDFVVEPGKGLTAMHILAAVHREVNMGNIVAALGKQLISSASCQGIRVDHQREDDCRTALCVAVESSNYDVASLLLEAGSDPNIPDRNGVSALSLLTNKAQPGALADEPAENRDAILQLTPL